MPKTIAPGATGQATWQEFSGPNGTGDKLAPAGPESYTSSDPAVATIDPTSGVYTGVVAGTTTISGLDSANNLTASDVLTVAEVAQSATLTL